jgi:hypothetical protein
MLLHHYLRLNEHQRLLPPTPEPPQYHPEQSVRESKLKLCFLRLKKQQAIATGPNFPTPNRDENGKSWSPMQR